MGTIAVCLILILAVAVAASHISTLIREVRYMGLSREEIPEPAPEADNTFWSRIRAVFRKIRSGVDLVCYWVFNIMAILWIGCMICHLFNVIFH